MSDQRQRFLFEGQPVRGQYVRLGAAFAEAVRNQRHGADVTQLLGEMLAASALLANLLREGDLTLQARGNGPVRSAMSECHGGTGLRAIARLAPDQAIAATDDAASSRSVAALDALLGVGDMALTIRPPHGELQQSIVSRTGYSLAGCLEDYFATSEQLPTRLWLTADGASRDGVCAGGLLLQRLPLHPEATASQAARADRSWRAITAAASALTAKDLLLLPAEVLLPRLFPGMDIRLFAADAMHFAAAALARVASRRCACSGAPRSRKRWRNLAGSP